MFKVFMFEFFSKQKYFEHLSRKCRRAAILHFLVKRLLFFWIKTGVNSLMCSLSIKICSLSILVILLKFRCGLQY